MKKLLLTFSFAAFVTVSNAQITLTQSNISIPSKKTQVKDWMVLPGSSLNSISVGASQTWDFSTLNTGIADSFALAPNTNSNFSNTAMALNSQVTITPVNYVIGQQIRSEDANGLYISGYYFADSTYLLSSIGPNDFFYMPSQSVEYKNRQNIIGFPATYEKGWKSANKTTMTFYLTVNSFGLVHDTGSKVSNFSVYDTVAGWGNIIIKLPGIVSTPVQALMVKETVLSTDSFYINKQLAVQPLLSLFNISKNGATTADYRTYFYVANLPDYLMYIDYGTDNTRSHPVSAYYSQDNFPTSSIEIPENNLIGFSEFPNPANGSFNCKLSKSDPAQWTLSLINTLGQTVKTQYVSVTGNLQVPVDVNGFKPGLYILNITDGNGAVEASNKVEIR